MVIFHSYVSLPERNHTKPISFGNSATSLGEVDVEIRNSAAAFADLKWPSRTEEVSSLCILMILEFRWGWVKTLVPPVNPKIAGIYGCSSHYSNVSIGIDPYPDHTTENFTLRRDPQNVAARSH